MKLNNYEIKGFIKVALLFFAFLIGFSSLWFTNNLVKKLASQEREKIATWANATRQIAASEGDNDINFIYEIIQGNTTIPVILTNEKGEVIKTSSINPFKNFMEIFVSDISGEAVKDHMVDKYLKVIDKWDGVINN